MCAVVHWGSIKKNNANALQYLWCYVHMCKQAFRDWSVGPALAINEKNEITETFVYVRKCMGFFSIVCSCDILGL